MKKLNNAKTEQNSTNIETYKTDIEELNKSIADAAKGLCRKSLRYKGKDSFVGYRCH